MNRCWLIMQQQIQTQTEMFTSMDGLSTHGVYLDILISSHTPKIPILTGADNNFGSVAFLIHHSIKSKVIEKAENCLILEIQTTNDAAVVGGVSRWKTEVLNKGTSYHFPILFSSPNTIVYNFDHEAFFILFSDFLASQPTFHNH
ncbi:unnamed protein product [Rotaria magnacalcarata]|uniref:Uncharacterized protein n=1 Tax=Rotaria magnacalcarata TaxID=392030 RepID=A0A819WC33_9BILA|nr:unnamed protein product [Rotaria magnacalcarata]CAF4123501.1 unnamed protein product [Rotaria magnacalcarata]